MRLVIAAGILLLGQAALAPRAAAQAQPVAALPMVQWTKFVDPVEGAFSLDVPRGWKNVGGTVRRNALQVFGYEITISPDGTTLVAINDPSLVSYVTPTALMAEAGFRIGSVYDGGGGTRYIVAPYQTGQQFAAWYGQVVLPRMCTGLRLTGSAARPDVGQQLTQLERSFGLGVDAGQATFTCSRNGMPMTGYVFAQINTIGSQYGAIWYEMPLLTFLTPTPLSGAIAGMLSHMLASEQVNPQWLARQEQTNMAVSQIATQTEAVISQGIMQGYESREATLDKVMDEGSRARLGIDYYSDPATGQQYMVDNTHNYYWSDAQGNVVGTDTDTSPGPGYSALRRVPPQ